MTNIQLSEINLDKLEVLGEGCNGIAYNFKGKVLKQTESQAEYMAAIKLYQAPQAWASRILDYKALEDTFLILKEKVDLVDFKEKNEPFPGHLWGISVKDPKFKDRAICPPDICLGLQHAEDGKPCRVEPFSDDELELLLSHYASAPLKSKCFRWFVNTFWKVKDSGFDTRDLWSNIGINQHEEFVFFDLMIAEA